MTHLPIDGVVIGQHPLVSRIMKGIFNLRPPQPRYQTMWSVQDLVKHFLSLPDNDELSMKQLSGKLACLLALCAANRCGELHALDVRYMVSQPDLVTFELPSLAKTQQPGQPVPKFSYATMPELNSKVCPVRCIHTYLHRTKLWRPLVITPTCSEPNALFRALISPHKAVSRDTISRWIKTSLDEAGIDTSVFKAHSTRGAATSAAIQNGVSLTDVLTTARWSSATTFERYYHKRISTPQTRFGLAVLTGP